MFLQGAAQLSKLMVPTVTHKPTHHQCALFVTNLDTNLKHCIVVSRYQHDFAKVCAAVEVHGANCNSRTDRGSAQLSKCMEPTVTHKLTSELQKLSARAQGHHIENDSSNTPFPNTIHKLDCSRCDSRLRSV